MKLIVGLGNPGKEYTKTRHNVGFMAIDAIANNYNILINKKKFNGIYNELNVNGEKIILLKPQNFINLSGEVLKKYIDYFKISLENILVIVDDLDLKNGIYKIKFKGGSGGHNGLKNIEDSIGTKNYKRIKIGISNNKNIDTKNYVLGKITNEEMKKLQPIMQKMPDIFNDYCKLTFDNLMNKYNKSIDTK